MADHPPTQLKRRKRVGRPPARDRTDRRQALLDSAIALFAQHGFANVELRQIASDAGVTVGMIRHYFGGKDGLIDEAIALVVQRLQTVYQRIISDIDADSGEQFIDVLYQRTYEVLLPQYDLLLFLKHMAIELPDRSVPVFRTYFDLIQSELNGLEATGKIDPEINKVWLTFLLMFIQLGPVFLASQIEQILGRSARDPEAAKLRNANNARILKYGLVKRSRDAGSVI